MYIVCYPVADAGAVIRIRVTDSVVRVRVETASIRAVVSITAQHRASLGIYSSPSQVAETSR